MCLQLCDCIDSLNPGNLQTNAIDFNQYSFDSAGNNKKTSSVTNNSNNLLSIEAYFMAL